LVGKARCQQEWKEETNYLIVYTQSMSNTDCAEQKGYDAGRKISGIKRHITVDIEVFPMQSASRRRILLIELERLTFYQAIKIR
jgi:hypothetical protein